MFLENLSIAVLKILKILRIYVRNFPFAHLAWIFNKISFKACNDNAMISQLWDTIFTDNLSKAQLTSNHSFIHNFTFSHQNHVNPEEEIEIVLSILSSESNFFLFLSFPHSPPSTKWLFAWKKYLCHKSTSMLCTTIALYSIRCFFQSVKPADTLRINQSHRSITFQWPPDPLLEIFFTN